MKVTYRIGLKMPIEGVQFSNIESAMEWEIEGDDADEILEELKGKLAEWLETQTTGVGSTVKNTIQELNTRLEKAREMFLAQKKGE